MISGLIYDSAWNRASGAVWLELPDSVNRYPLTVNRSNYLRLAISDSRLAIHDSLKFFANLMLLIGAAGVLLTMLPVAAMEIKYQAANRYPLTANRQENQTISDSRLAINETAPGPTSAADAFSVSIPKIAVQSVIVPNVDPADPSIYMAALKQGVAHALGTGLPGVRSDINRTIYLFAHSTFAPSLVTRYNAQFYLLHRLEAGDTINITYWARPYRYQVTGIKIVEASDTSWLRPQTEKEILVLAACWPPGTTFKRLLVLAERTGYW